MPRAELPRRTATALVTVTAFAAAAFVTVFLGSCRFNYGSAGDASGKEGPPTAVFTNYQHTVVTRGAPSFRLTAAKAEVYDSDKKTVLSDVRFSEFDPDTGELVSSGRADQAIYYSENGDADFSGDVRLESKRQDAVLVGEYLRWDGKAKRLSGGLDRTVTISRSDGSRVSGAGFEAEALRRSFSFRGSVDGSLVVKDETAGSSQ